MVAEHDVVEQSLRIREDRRALYAIAQDKVIALIRQGFFTAGSCLPPQDKLAEMLGVSRATVREAIRGVAQMGLVLQRQGVGTIVSAGDRRIHRGMEILESLESIAERQGWRCGSRSVSITRPRADRRLAKRLGIPQGDSVTRVFRVKTANGNPIAHMTDYVPEVIMPSKDLKRRFKGSVLDLLYEQNEPPVDHASVVLTAVRGTREVAQRLGLPAGTPLLFTEETVYGPEGKILDIGETYFATTYFRFALARRSV